MTQRAKLMSEADLRDGRLVTALGLRLVKTPRGLRLRAGSRVLPIKPQLREGLRCKVCGSTDTVGLVLNEGTEQEDSLTWCSCGTVDVRDHATGKVKSVHDFR